jgi:hypothetical protein
MLTSFTARKFVASIICLTLKHWIICNIKREPKMKFQLNSLLMSSFVYRFFHLLLALHDVFALSVRGYRKGSPWCCTGNQSDNCPFIVLHKNQLFCKTMVRTNGILTNLDEFLNIMQTCQQYKIKISK